MIRIYIDADACPVKEEILRIAERHDLHVYMVSNAGLRPSRNPKVEHIVVSKGFDAADDWIAERADAQSIVITNDIPLASRCVSTGAAALSPSGKVFTPENIGTVLAMRNLNAHLRETGESKGYNAPFSKQDRSRFLWALEEAIQRLKRQFHP
jgi:uncharacterized protein YaiI (UPF0178 family)